MNEEAKRRIAEAMENKLIELDLSECELTKIPDEIREMAWLEKLYLNSNQISEIKNVEQLTQLTWCRTTHTTHLAFFE